MTVIETSKLLLECADWLEVYGNASTAATGIPSLHNQWADSIRSIAIPAPLGSDDEKRE